VTADQIKALIKRIRDTQSDCADSLNAASVLESLSLENQRLRVDAERLDFVEQKRCTWYPGRASMGYGVLCFDHALKRPEVTGKTYREAIDAARSQSEEENL
jgi:hypothetical protein